MRPNLFHFATSELSQDALLCWLLSWSKESLEDENEALHRVGKHFLDVLIEISDLEAPQKINELEVRRQEGGIDVLAIINNEKVVLIEDKRGTQEHSNQLARYIKHVVEKLEIDEESIIPIYIQTGDQSDFREVARNGYSVLDREMFLKVLESEVAVQARAESDLLNDYAIWLREIEDDVQSFRNTPPADWSWNAWKGFYAWLQNTLRTGNWDYVANPTGGFLGFWWHFVGIEQGEIYLQIEQGKFCFKIWMKQPGKQRTIQRQHFHEQVMLHSQEQGITARRPQRFGYGYCMTVAILDQDFPVVAASGLIDLEATLAVIHAAEVVVDSCE